MRLTLSRDCPQFPDETFRFREGDREPLDHHHEIAVDDVYARRNKSHEIYGDAASHPGREAAS